ncbi:MAG: PAS domain-containing sensor histidine kinase [Cyclobacteriaceae bacterium]
MDGMVDVRKIFDSVSEIWILVDRQGKVLLISKHLDLFQHVIQPRIVEGVSLFDSIPESWQQLAKNVLTSLLYTNASSTLEASYSQADDKETHFEIKCSGVRDNDGEVNQIFIEARDVTPQKIFEKKITIIAREYQSVIENANAVIIGTDARGYITEWNEMARQVTGYSKNESYIQKLSDFLSLESQENFSNAINNVLNGQVVTNYELIIRAKDEKKLTLLINATPRASATSEVIGVLLIGQDITELSAYRQSLEQKVKERTDALKSALENEKQLVELKDRFVSMASHEFRSPISYIHRNIEGIKDQIEKLSTADIRARLEKIQSQAQHLSSLLEDVLTIGKSGATNTKIKANLKTVDFKEFFFRIIDEVQSNTQHTHRITLDFPELLPVIQSDENLLRNIFVNLLTNAIKFSPGQNEVFLTVRACDHHVKCTVRDHGLGIEEKDLPRIFEPFHRGDNVQKIKGTGLGLPIVRKAVETLGGEVGVESKPGEGTLFSVKLNLYHL